MALVAFDLNDKLHHDLFENFKIDLISDINGKDHLFAKSNNYIDEMNIIIRDLAVNELGLDSDISEFDSYWTAAIADKNPQLFTIIIGIEFYDMETEKDDIEFIKAEGEMLVEDDKLIIWNIDTCSLDYSSYKEFKMARKTY